LISALEFQAHQLWMLSKAGRCKMFISSS
jgi:hypothetical protein